MKTVGIAILAAGKGTRLKIDRAKVLCPALGLTLFEHVARAALDFAAEAKLETSLTAVVGHKREEVMALARDKFGSAIQFAWQKEQLGTGDALRSYFRECPQNEKCDYTFVVCADTPLVRAETFARLWRALQATPELVATAGSFVTAKPTGYGRIIRQGKGFRIVEEKDATPAERAVTEVNSGFYLVRTAFLLEALKGLSTNNQAGEFYLTDVFTPDAAVAAVTYPDEREFLGVNTLEQLEQATQVLRSRKLSQLMLSGVTCYDAATTWVDVTAEVAPGAVLYPGVQLYGHTKIGAGVVVESGAIIRDSVIEAGAEVLAYSHIDRSHVRTGAQVGPFARLRPQADIGAKAKVGNFVEIKKSRLDAGAKVSHLSYVGDAEIGAETNIGCGFITCNYDGRDKHQSKIGAGVFIGSDVQLIAPIEIGDRAFVAAGSTVSRDVPADGFAIARAQIAVKPGMAQRFMKSKKSN